MRGGGIGSRLRFETLPVRLANVVFASFVHSCAAHGRFKGIVQDCSSQDSFLSETLPERLANVVFASFVHSFAAHGRFKGIVALQDGWHGRGFEVLF